MTITTVRNIIKDQLRRRGIKYTDRDSVSSDSVYFTIYFGETTLLFRVSDHSTKKPVITLRTDKKLDRDRIIRFVNNRYDDLKYRCAKRSLGI